MSTTFVDLCEPLFQYICQLNRQSQIETVASKPPSFQEVRRRVQELLNQIRDQAKGDARLARQYAMVVRQNDHALIFFVDAMMASSSLPFARQWDAERMAHKINNVAGEQRFYEMLDELLDRESQEDDVEDIREVLAFFYVCLCLGFTGQFEGQPEEIKERIDRLFPKVSHRLHQNPRKPIFELAYKVDTTKLTVTPAGRLAFLLVILLFLVLSTFVIYYAWYGKAVEELQAALQEILKHAPWYGK
jgi:type IV/VI secretion system ImpK/VasF family protein